MFTRPGNGRLGTTANGTDTGVLVVGMASLANWGAVATSLPGRLIGPVGGTTRPGMPTEARAELTVVTVLVAFVVVLVTEWVVVGVWLVVGGVVAGGVVVGVALVVGGVVGGHRAGNSAHSPGPVAAPAGVIANAATAAVATAPAARAPRSCRIPEHIVISAPNATLSL